MPKQVTSWYPGSIKPVRAGVYERIFSNDGSVFLSYWDGLTWCREADHQPSLYQQIKWRGRTYPYPGYKEK